jgi:hypothetical protein
MALEITTVVPSAADNIVALDAKKPKTQTLAQLRERADQLNNMTAYEVSRLPMAKQQALQKEAYSLAVQLEKRGGAVDESRIQNLNALGDRIQGYLERNPRYNGPTR